MLAAGIFTHRDALGWQPGKDQMNKQGNWWLHALGHYDHLGELLLMHRVTGEISMSRATPKVGRVGLSSFTYMADGLWSAGLRHVMFVFNGVPGGKVWWWWRRPGRQHVVAIGPVWHAHLQCCGCRRAIW